MARIRGSPRGQGAGEELKIERPARPAQPRRRLRKLPACRADGTRLPLRGEPRDGFGALPTELPAGPSPGPGPRLCTRPRRPGAGVAEASANDTLSGPAPRGPRRHSQRGAAIHTPSGVRWPPAAPCACRAPRSRRAIASGRASASSAAGGASCGGVGLPTPSLFSCHDRRQATDRPWLRESTTNGRSPTVGVGGAVARPEERESGRPMCARRRRRFRIGIGQNQRRRPPRLAVVTDDR